MDYCHGEVALIKGALIEAVSYQVAFGEIAPYELAFIKLSVS